MTAPYYDYLFKFPLASLTTALEALTALRSANIIVDGDIPTNMLGDPRDASGNVVTSGPAFVGRLGIAATSYIDPSTQQSVAVSARGDPDYWYVAIRSDVDPSSIPFDPSSYGLQTCDPTENAAVLGVWA
jgi:hypothetical protein